MRALYLIAVYVHLLSAIVWIGGMASMALLLVPAIRRRPFSEHGAALMHFAGMRFRAIGWTCLALLALTGVFALHVRVGLPALGTSELWSGDFGRVLAYKLGFVGLILLLGVAHDLFIGPRATAALQASPGSAEGERLR